MIAVAFGVLIESRIAQMGEIDEIKGNHIARYRPIHICDPFMNQFPPMCLDSSGGFAEALHLAIE